MEKNCCILLYSPQHICSRIKISCVSVNRYSQQMKLKAGQYFLKRMLNLQRVIEPKHQKYTIFIFVYIWEEFVILLFCFQIFLFVQMVILLINLGLNVLFDAVKVVKVSQILLPQKFLTLEPLHNFALRSVHHMASYSTASNSGVEHCACLILWILFIYFFHASAIFWACRGLGWKLSIFCILFLCGLMWILSK